MHRSDRRRGYSMIEVVITMAITIIVLIAVYAVIGATVKQDEAIRARVEIQIEATRCIQELTSLLKTAGPVDANGNGTWQAGEYPVFTDDGSAFPSAYASFSDLNDVGTTGRNSPATHYIGTVDPDGFGGTSNEIIFRLPRDRDGDKHPTDASGNIEWGKDNVSTETAFYAIAIVSNPNVKLNELQIRQYNGTAFGTTLLKKTVLTRNLDRIQFKARGSGGVPTGFCSPGAANLDPDLGLNQLAITLWFWKKDLSGKDVKIVQSTTVNLRSVDR